MKHLNRLVKESIAGLRANKSDAAIKRVGKAIDTLYPVLEQFDMVNSVPRTSGAHSKPASLADTKLVLHELRQEQMFKQMDKKEHHHIKSLLHHQPDKLVNWMTGHVKKLKTHQK